MAAGFTSPIADLTSGPSNYNSLLLDAIAAGDTQPPGVGYRSLWNYLETTYGLPSGYLDQTANIESRYDANASAAPISSAAGLYQFIKSTGEQYGLFNKKTGQDIRTDPLIASIAAAKLAADDMPRLTDVLGRAPTAPELYLSHNLGIDKAIEVLENPSATMGSLGLGVQASKNGYTAGGTAQGYLDKWTQRFNFPEYNDTSTAAGGFGPDAFGLSAFPNVGMGTFGGSSFGNLPADLSLSDPRWLSNNSDPVNVPYRPGQPGAPSLPANAYGYGTPNEPYPDNLYGALPSDSAFAQGTQGTYMGMTPNGAGGWTDAFGNTYSNTDLGLPPGFSSIGAFGIPDGALPTTGPMPPSRADSGIDALLGNQLGNAEAYNPPNSFQVGNMPLGGFDSQEQFGPAQPAQPAGPGVGVSADDQNPGLYAPFASGNVGGEQPAMQSGTGGVDTAVIPSDANTFGKGPPGLPSDGLAGLTGRPFTGLGNEALDTVRDGIPFQQQTAWDNEVASALGISVDELRLQRMVGTPEPPGPLNGFDQNPAPSAGFFNAGTSVSADDQNPGLYSPFAAGNVGGYESGAEQFGPYPAPPGDQSFAQGFPTGSMGQFGGFGQNGTGLIPQEQQQAQAEPVDNRTIPPDYQVPAPNRGFDAVMLSLVPASQQAQLADMLAKTPQEYKDQLANGSMTPAQALDALQQQGGMFGSQYRAAGEQMLGQAGGPGAVSSALLSDRTPGPFMPGMAGPGDAAFPNARPSDLTGNPAFDYPGTPELRIGQGSYPAPPQDDNYGYGTPAPANEYTYSDNYGYGTASPAFNLPQFGTGGQDFGPSQPPDGVGAGSSQGPYAGYEAQAPGPRDFSSLNPAAPYQTSYEGLYGSGMFGRGLQSQPGIESAPASAWDSPAYQFPASQPEDGVGAGSSQGRPYAGFQPQAPGPTDFSPDIGTAGWFTGQNGFGNGITPSAPQPAPGPTDFSQAGMGTFGGGLADFGAGISGGMGTQAQWDAAANQPAGGSPSMGFYGSPGMSAIQPGNLFGDYQGDFSGYNTADNGPGTNRSDNTGYTPNVTTPGIGAFNTSLGPQNAPMFAGDMAGMNPSWSELNLGTVYSSPPPADYGTPAPSYGTGGYGGYDMSPDINFSAGGGGGGFISPSADYFDPTGTGFGGGGTTDGSQYNTGGGWGAVDAQMQQRQQQLEAEQYAQQAAMAQQQAQTAAAQYAMWNSYNPSYAPSSGFGYVAPAPQAYNGGFNYGSAIQVGQGPVLSSNGGFM